MKTGHRQTAFFHFPLAGTLQEGGIDQHQRLISLFGDIDDDDSFLDIDLIGAQGNAARIAVAERVR